MNKASNQQSTVALLRGLIPSRQLEVWEAKRLAELQTNHLRRLLDNSGPAFDVTKIESLPRMHVTKDPKLASSGATTWIRGGWHISINSAEVTVRQRFTLAHEFKHVLDAPSLECSYAHIANNIGGDQQIESICDHFAACLLMPKRLVKRLWGDGLRDLTLLARAFNVSTAAMKVRLETTGLIERPTRCAQPRLNKQWASARSRPNFERQPQPQLIGDSS